jgi:regulation of enolase protein 1 (concanavalin A-like superfamily)
MPAGVWVGLAVTSHRDGALATATFDSIAFANGPPAVSLTAPASGAVFTAPATIALTASASDGDGTVARVDFYAGVTLVGTATASPYSVVWNGVPAGTYNLTAVATDDRGAGTTSAAVDVAVQEPPSPPTTPPTTPPSPGGLSSPWQAQDVGSVSPAGTATLAGTTFTLTGGGADIWDTADAFHYVYQPLSGNGEIVARVASVPNTHVWAKAGIMIRKNLTPGATYAALLLTPANGVAFQRRLQNGGGSQYTPGAGTAPAWLKLTRDADVVRVYTSGDKTNWVPVGTETLSLPGPAFVGLATTSHYNGLGGIATFDDVTVTAGEPWLSHDSGTPTTGEQPWSSQDIGTTTPAGTTARSGSTFTVAGAGADIWGTTDAFRYVYQPLSGDGAIVARIAAVQNTNGWAKAGVMIREDLSAGSRYAALLVSPANGLAFQRRAQPNAGTSYAPGSGTPPTWLKIARAGNTITAYQSGDGANWVPVGTDNLALGGTVTIGLAVTSHNDGALNVATFEDVSR